MARLLGRSLRRPSCCPRDDDWLNDSTGGRRLQRHRESQDLKRSLRDRGRLTDPLADPSDCRHGCNGDDVVRGYGSDVCDFTCHPGLALDPEKAARYEAALERWQQAARDGRP
jgi:hypothetical protein